VLLLLLSLTCLYNINYMPITWQRFVATPALRASLARCAGKSSLQTRRRKCRPTAACTAKHHGTWQTSVYYCPTSQLSTAAYSIRYSTFFGGSALPAQHTRSTAFSVAGPSLWNSVPDSLRDPDLGRDNFRRLLKTHLLTLYWIKNYRCFRTISYTHWLTYLRSPSSSNGILFWCRWLTPLSWKTYSTRKCAK